jgi:hypothetical protein
MKPRDGPAVDMKETIMATTKSKSSVKQQPALFERRPTHRLYRVIGDGDTAIWTPIGAAWPNKDGKGFNLSCDAIPLTGRLVLRMITAREAIEGGQQ